MKYFDREFMTGSLTDKECDKRIQTYDNHIREILNNANYKIRMLVLMFRDESKVKLLGFKNPSGNKICAVHSVLLDRREFDGIIKKNIGHDSCRKGNMV